MAVPEPERPRRRLIPVLADEPLVGEHLARRVRIVLIAVVVAFVLTNATSYLIGQAVRAEVDRDTRARIAHLEAEVSADLEERRRQRDAQAARQDAELRQLRRDACVLADRIQPRDAEVQRLRRRYDCTGNPPRPTPAPSAGRPGPGGTPGRGPAAGGGTPPRPTPSTGRPPRPSSPPPTTPPPGGGLICLPLVGCLL